MPSLLRTQAALGHLESFSSREGYDSFRDAFVEILCVRAIAVMCIAEVEEIVSVKLQARLGSALDPRAALFISAKLADILKRTQKSDVAKTIKLFGPDCADRFNACFEQQELAAYENVRTGRHDTAHGDGTNIGYSDLVRGIEAAEKIVEKFEQCIAYP